MKAAGLKVSLVMRLSDDDGAGLDCQRSHCGHRTPLCLDSAVYTHSALVSGEAVHSPRVSTVPGCPQSKGVHSLRVSTVPECPTGSDIVMSDPVAI